MTEEIVLNLHMHTTYSDGSGSHHDLARAALQAGVDAILVTDHNVLVAGFEGYYREGKKRLLLLIGEEIHDQSLDPQRNHLLVFNARRELATFAPETQILLDNVRRAGGLAFIAHPHDPVCEAIKETDILWERWEVQGYTGLELWNHISELKVRSHTLWQIVFYAFFPNLLTQGPQPETILKWDELLNNGQKVVALGGSDAHAFPGQLGPIKRAIFPYEYHFRAINTHLLLTSPLTGEVEADQALIYAALAAGHAFVGYDLPASTRGFNFSAQGREIDALMGDEIPAEGGVTLKIKLPQLTECRLLKDGQVLQTWHNRETCTHLTTEPGVYRVEVYKRYLGQRRAWIFSNPIYVRE
jgi:hypothetical protein